MHKQFKTGIMNSNKFSKTLQSIGKLEKRLCVLCAQGSFSEISGQTSPVGNWLHQLLEKLQLEGEVNLHRGKLLYSGATIINSLKKLPLPVHQRDLLAQLRNFGRSNAKVLEEVCGQHLRNLSKKSNRKYSQLSQQTQIHHQISNSHWKWKRTTIPRPVTENKTKEIRSGDLQESDCYQRTLQTTLISTESFL